MRAVIEAVCRSVPSGLRRPSSIELAAEAGRRALEAAGDLDVLDLMLSVGLYQDDHVQEPALAPLIQRRIALLARRRDVFSFDIANGACGLVDALRVTDAFVRAGTVRRALLVASDVDPNPGRSVGISFGAVGVAVLVGARDASEGFGDFYAETFTKHAHLYESRLTWLGPGRSGWLRRPRGHAVTARTGEAYADRCVESTALAAARFLEAHHLTAEDLDLLVVPEAPAGLPTRLAKLLGVSEERVAGCPDSAGTCSAAPGLALEAAFASGRLARARRALLVGVGSGISVSLALYGRDC